MTETPVAAASSGSYFARHWRGALSLPRSYWINGVIVGIACRIVFAGLLMGAAAAVANLPAFVLLFVLIVLVNIAVLVWIFVGIWRSAGRYTGPKFWGILARVAVVLGVISDVIVEIANFSNLATLITAGG